MDIEEVKKLIADMKELETKMEPLYKLAHELESLLQQQADGKS